MNRVRNGGRAGVNHHVANLSILEHYAIIMETGAVNASSTMRARRFFETLFIYSG